MFCPEVVTYLVAFNLSLVAKFVFLFLFVFPLLENTGLTCYVFIRFFSTNWDILIFTFLLFIPRDVGTRKKECFRVNSFLQHTNIIQGSEFLKLCPGPPWLNRSSEQQHACSLNTQCLQMEVRDRMRDLIQLPLENWKYTHILEVYGGVAGLLVMLCFLIQAVSVGESSFGKSSSCLHRICAHFCTSVILNNMFTEI